eukprot:545289_1
MEQFLGSLQKALDDCKDAGTDAQSKLNKAQQMGIDIQQEQASYNTCKENENSAIQLFNTCKPILEQYDQKKKTLDDEIKELDRKIITARQKQQDERKKKSLNDLIAIKLNNPRTCNCANHECHNKPMYGTITKRNDIQLTATIHWQCGISECTTFEAWENISIN